MAGSAYPQGFLALRGGTNLVGNAYRVRETKAAARLADDAELQVQVGVGAQVPLFRRCR